MIRQDLTCKKFLLAVVLSFSVISLFAADRYSVASGNWNSTATWSATSGGAPGATVPGKNDNVFIENSHTITVSEDQECTSLAFTGAIAALTVNSPATLSVKSYVTLNNLTNLNSACILAGTGTLTCAEVNVGSDVNPPPTDPSSSVYTHTFTSRLAFLNISVKGAPKNDITIYSFTGGTSHLRNGIFNPEEGIVTVDGQVVTINQTGSNTSSLSMATGVEAGTLNLRGKASPFTLSGTGTNSVNLNGTASLVNYSMTAAQTVLPTTYNNLTLSGSGAKTLSGTTVLGTLSREGTSTAAGTAPIYGTASALQYKGSAAQTTGIEFPAVFSGTGGIIVDNSFDVTLNNNRTISSNLTFINGRFNTGLYILSLSSSAAVLNAGPGRYVNGNLQKGISPGTTSKTFEIGDASVYAPVVLSFTGTITSEGTITAKTTAGDHPNIGTSTFLAGVTVNRYWNLASSGVPGIISYNATFNYVPGDIDAGADYNNFYVGNYSSSIWTYPATGTKAPASTQSTGLVSFGDFQIGELPIASFRSRNTGNWNLTSTWESFDGTSWINSATTPTSASGFITIRPTHVVTNTGLLTADQVIVDAGGILVLNSAMNINDGAGIDFTVNGTLDCNNNILTGNGSFLLDNFAELIVYSADGISSSGAVGDIRTTTRTFRPYANYTYKGTTAQLTGTGFPDSANNLTIDNSSGVTLSAPATVNGSLFLTSGALSVGTSTLTFQGSDNPIVRTSGNLTTTRTSNLQFGTPLNTTGAGFTIPSGTFSDPAYINNLTINRVNNLTLNDQVLSLCGILLCNGPLDTNGNLTLVSDASGTALIDGAGTGMVSNLVTMQRYLPSAFGYKYISSPFMAATVSELGDELLLSDEFPVLYGYYEGSTTSGWVDYVAPANSLNPLAGYAANFGSSALPITADMTGIVNNGPFSVTLYNHDNTFTKGFNLVGNPYPSPIDWNAPSGWTKSNIDNALYYFKASPTDEYGGRYSTWINGVSSDDTVTNIIPSMQGFFIHVTDGTFPVEGTLGLDNTVRVNNLTQIFAKSGKKSPADVLRISASFADIPESSDPAVIYFDEKAGTGFDPDLDALKLINTDYNVPSIYSVGTDGRKLSINAFPECTDTLCIIPLGLKTSIDGNIVFRLVDVEAELAGMKISITDKTSGTEKDLLNNQEYRLFLKAGEYLNRFYLNLRAVATEIPDIRPEDDLFSVYSSRGVIKSYINIEKTGTGNLSVLNLAGQTMFVERISKTGYNIFYPGIKDGIYIVSFVSEKYRGSRKIFIQNR